MRYKKLSLGLAAGALALGGAVFVVRPAVAQAFSGSGVGAAFAQTLRGGLSSFNFFGGGPGIRRHGPQLLIDATASVTGLTAQDVRTQLQAGKSLAQIAESKGKTADDVIAAARTTLQAQLKQAVTDGHITQAQADTELQRFDANAKQVVNATNLGQRPQGFGGNGGSGGFGHGGAFGLEGRSLLDATASVAGLTAQDVRTQLQAGKSLAQIAESKGKTADDVIAAARTTLQAQLKQAVTDGHITQAQADTELQRFDANAKQVVNATNLGQRPQGFGGNGGSGGFGYGGAFGLEGRSLLDATASVAGLTAQDVRTQLQAGKSLAQIAESKGKTADDVIAAARTILQAQLKQAVTDGHITQAQADTELQRFDANAKQMVNSVPSAGPWGGPHFTNPGATPDTSGNSA